jgi:hypothetical protein
LFFLPGAIQKRRRAFFAVCCAAEYPLAGRDTGICSFAFNGGFRRLLQTPGAAAEKQIFY